MSDSGYHIWPTGPEIEAVYPVAQRIETEYRQGRKVYRRTIIVIDDWQEVPGPTPPGKPR